MKIYQTPTAEVLELNFEAAVLVGSTESFNKQEDYDGDWA